ncbi:o-succinylbenzoate--CoA ligase [Lysinibacillus odysseyi]|uniref:2-succinylbenzoate--CoA ligase n=1 Tax=Lysinibacillus odysseyi 34hs-1 = NBRC 100172 TaxID=1220589 RepID=A0A0A3IWE0_9BACI|nr:o-succinylbenzoate--CoA ligase [Lysinibacillus odysseyi]KGR87745.1 O-succinylbenzoic acid--CoA ligase [Lysinibacillus odysseyi 34hs-1 = NBRC 100172]
MQPNWLAQRSYLTPNRIGLSYNDKQWTFKELYDEAVRIAGKLASFHLDRGDRIALLAPSRPELISMIYGCMERGVEIVFLNGRLSSYELHYQIQDAQVKAVIVHEEEQHKLPEDTDSILFTEVFCAEEIKIEAVEEWSDDATISIMYTSGTTGFPKGVRQTVQNHSASAISSVLNLGLRDSDVWLCTMPIFHISGFSILMRSLLYGMHVRLYEKFDAASCATEIAEGSVTRMSAVAVTLERILSYMEERGMKAHPNFQSILAGGGPVPVDYLRRADKLHLQVVQTYGMTETSSQTATLSSEDAMEKAGSAGKPLFFNQIRIEGAAKPGDEGEICIRGPHVTPGYIGRFANRPAMENGWLKTGDIGYLDEEGYLYVIDRRADLIISGGENIYPAEIENVLLAHPAVKEAGVSGIDDPVWGKVPAAFIVLKNEATVEELLTFCKGRLASYKMPKKVLIVDQLPRNGSNKLVRRRLTELL